MNLVDWVVHSSWIIDMRWSVVLTALILYLPDEESTKTMTCGTENKNSQNPVFFVFFFLTARKVIYESHKCHWLQAAVSSVKKCWRMFACVLGGSVLVVKVRKEKQIASSDANSTGVIKAFITVLHHSAVNRPSRPAAPAKSSSFLLSSSLPVVFINHKLTTQAEKQDCCALWTHIHCVPCASACGSNKFTLPRKFPKGARSPKWDILYAQSIK